MKIEVLGTGCAKCNKLETAVRSAADKLGIAYQIEHIRDINTIVQRGVMIPPALVIDGQVVVSGRVPTESELTSWLTSSTA